MNPADVKSAIPGNRLEAQLPDAKPHDLGGANVAAGSVITEDVPAGAVAFGRADAGTTRYVVAFGSFK